ncbi:fasciclin domain-containing protein [Rufibacter psychrotolerans]|uniref:fasciclin domain-containing protein n=1 Tax=Rufibacter psychrotolerans TaxID=2812556 RepID=UPI0019683047|nr:fasciclin domain-containing protein [Rufibacter sp. SYSU D00308]
MANFIKHSFRLLLALFLFAGCEQKEDDAFYERPAGLAEPIYQELEKRGNFTNFLVCIEKAGYKDILSKAGYWTIFAPNDEAFKKYFAENGIASVESIDAKTAEKIVKYSLVYNAFKAERLADYQSGLGWVNALGLKRRTAYYEGAQLQQVNGEERLVVSSNRNNRSGSDYYNVDDTNNKYIPYFLSKVFTAKGLTAADYNYFYPNSTFSGFNVGPAKVVSSDITAENGFIHEIDRVILPLPNLDQYLADQSKYSKFKAIFDKYMVSYLVNAAATEKFSRISGVNKDVYVKVFNSGLSYSPNNENFLKVEDNDGQQGGYTLFAPTNAALENYLDNVLLKHYKSMDALPKEIIFDFLNAHMWDKLVWPSKFNSTPHSSLGQNPLFNPQTDVVEKKVLSNGMFYGTQRVQEANVFSSVFGKAYLNPRYSLMTRALSVALKPILINTSIKFTVFLVPDEEIIAAGFNYDLDANTWRYTPPAGGASSSGSTAWGKLNRILNTHVVIGDVSDLAGSGVLETYEGEYISFSHNKLLSAGNMEQQIEASSVAKESALNGTVYYLDKLLLEPQKSLGLHLKDLAEAPESRYKKFFDYLNNSSLFTKNTGAIVGVTASGFYTMLVPDNEAIDAAIAKGYLPASTSPSSAEDKEKVADFIRYHIIDKATIAPDGKKEGGYLTLLLDQNGNPATVTVSNAPGSLRITDQKGNSSAIVTGSSNNLSNRAVIHLLNGFLEFNK